MSIQKRFNPLHVARRGISRNRSKTKPTRPATNQAKIRFTNLHPRKPVQPGVVDSFHLSTTRTGDNKTAVSHLLLKSRSLRSLKQPKDQSAQDVLTRLSALDIYGGNVAHAIEGEQEKLNVSREELRQRLQQAAPHLLIVLERVFDDHFSDRDFDDIFTDNQLIDELAEIYDNTIESMSQELESKFNELKEDFIQQMLTHFDVDETIIRRKINRCEFVVSDPLQLGTAVGRYSYDSLTVQLSAHWIQTEGLRKTFFHEALHAISGESQVSRPHGIYNEHAPPHQQTRIGLQLMIPVDDHEANEVEGLSIQLRFRWLNEALTERLAIKLSRRKETGMVAMLTTLMRNSSGSYRKERRVLDMLFDICNFAETHYFTEEMLIENYFADDDIENKKPRMTGFRQFSKALGEVTGRNLLLEIDILYNNGQIDEALELVNSIHTDVLGADDFSENDGDDFEHDGDLDMSDDEIDELLNLIGQPD